MLLVIDCYRVCILFVSRNRICCLVYLNLNFIEVCLVFNLFKKIQLAISDFVHHNNVLDKTII